MEELSAALHSNNVDIAVITETWLSDTFPDGCININGFNVYRRDRNTHCGGIAMYFKSIYTCKIITLIEIPSLSCTLSEILAVFVSPINVVLVAIYHPFWGGSPQHALAITALEDIFDYTMRNFCLPVFVLALTVGLL
jgi:hypothetical protein